MRAFDVPMLAVAGAALLAAACASDAAPARSEPDAAPQTGTHPLFDVFVPPVHHTGDGAATEAGATKPSRVADAARPDATTLVVDASIDARSPLVDASRASIPDAERPPAGYPEGPYGTGVGQTFPFLRWEGYVERDADAGLVSDGPWRTYTSDDLRNSGKRLALVHLADFDCPGCNHAGAVLAARAPAAERDGAVVVEVLSSIEIQAAPADRAHLDAWITTYELHVTSVIDAPGHELATLNDVGVRETALVLDLVTMKIVYRSTGNLAPNGLTSLDGAFDFVNDALPD